MRISDWSSDGCSSDLAVVAKVLLAHDAGAEARPLQRRAALRTGEVFTFAVAAVEAFDRPVRAEVIAAANAVAAVVVAGRLAVELELGVDVAGFDPDEAVIGTVGHGRHRQQCGRQHARRQQYLAHVHSLNREARQWAVEGSSCLRAPSISAVTVSAH